jgi:hypothetical protein
VLDFVGNPYKAWESGYLLQKSKIQRLVFIRPLKYSKSKGFGTVEMSLPFSISAFQGFLTYLNQVWWRERDSNPR